jgi:hypothetical protein
VRGFQEALDKAGVSNTISIYKNEGHAFWTNMDQVLSLWTLHNFLHLNSERPLNRQYVRPNQIDFCDTDCIVSL